MFGGIVMRTTLQEKSNSCDRCVELGKFVGEEVETRTKSVGWAVLATTGVTIACVVGLKLVNEWLRSLAQKENTQ